MSSSVAENTSIATSLEIPKTPGITTAYYAFGRFQPPTIGHGKVFDTLKALASGKIVKNDKTGETYPRGDYFIVPSGTCDAPTAVKKTTSASAKRRKTDCEIKNPLRLEDKLEFLKKMYPNDESNILNIETLVDKFKELLGEAKLPPLPSYLPTNIKAGNITKSPVTVAYALFISGYKEVYLVVGGDEFKEMKGLEKSIQGTLTNTGYSFDLYNAGDRILSDTKTTSTYVDDKGNVNIEKVSGTDVRNAAKGCDFDKFITGVPKVSNTFQKKDRLKMFYKLRKALLSPDTDVFQDCTPSDLTDSVKKSLVI